MLFSTAIRILVNVLLYDRMNEKTEDFLKEFVSTGSNYYGSNFAVYSIHSLILLSKDAKRLGSLDTFKCFQV